MLSKFLVENDIATFIALSFVDIWTSLMYIQIGLKNVSWEKPL